MDTKEQSEDTPLQALLVRLRDVLGIGADDTDGSIAASELDGTEGGESGAEKSATQEFIDYTYEHSKADFVVKTGMTPEEMVLEMVNENDGRMRQKELASLVGWSDATVSRLLQDMEDEKSLNRFRLGREKIICEPTLAPTGFDEPMTAQSPGKLSEEENKIQSD
ncbi:MULTISPECIES: helix-turn-helix transcriptional regulator [unclassified Haladaptatus]|uniref:helix-turn-helix transcriptional regulator n=1 Tax=unclassified Haladaptatus TaxID=2622732 RepID=UPI002FCE1B49